MDLVVDERDSNVSSSKSGDDDDRDDDQASSSPSGFPSQPQTSSSRSSSFNQHSPDGSATPSAYNNLHQTKSVSYFIIFFDHSLTYRLFRTLSNIVNIKNICPS